MTLLKRKYSFDGLPIKRIAKIQKLSKLINFNNLIFYFKDKNGPKNFIDFTGPLGLINNIKNGYIKIKKKRKKKIKKNLKQV